MKDNSNKKKGKVNEESLDVLGGLPMKEMLKDQQKKYKKDAFIKNPVDLDRTYAAPQELDLFAMETRSRRTIGELIKPILADMDSDRRNIAMATVNLEKVFTRLERIEYSLKLSGTKPQIFVEIENTLADMVSSIALHKSESNYQTNLVNQKIQQNERELISTTQKINQIESSTNLRDKNVQECQQNLISLTKRMTTDHAKLERSLISLDGKVIISLEQNQSEVAKCTAAVKNFDEKISEMDQFVKSIFEQSSRNQTKISEIFDNKVDVSLFKKQVDDFDAQIDTIRMATYDNFRVIRATDNFLEKYMPFQIQDLISRNISSFIKKPYTDEEIRAGADLRLTPDQ